MSLPETQIKSILAGETRLVRRVDIPGIGAVILTRMWPEINKQDLGGCVDFLRANPSWMGLDQARNDKTSAPRIEGQEFAGSFVGSLPRLEWGKSDPATAGTESRLNLMQDLYLLNLTGASAVVEDSCQMLVTAYTVYFADSPPTVAGLHTVGVKWTVSDPILDLSTGLYTSTVKKWERQEQTFEFESEDRADQTERTAVKLGTADAIQELTPSDGEQQTRQIQKNDDCTNNETVQTKTAVDQISTLGNVQADRSVVTTIHSQNASTVTMPPVPNDGESRQASNEPTAFKSRTRTSAQTATAVKLESDQTFVDANGTNRHYFGQHLTLTELTAQLATISSANDATVSQQKSPEFKNRYGLTITEKPSNWTTPNNTQYEAIGEFIEPWVDKTTGKEFCRVTLYTTSKSSAQDYAVGLLSGKTYGQGTQVNSATISGVKSSWSTSRLTASQVYRNPRTGRYVAMREQMQLS